jgi:hypothetical protein
MEKPPVSLKAMAEAKADGIQKATFFKVRPDVVEFEDGFNLREEGPELDAHIERLYLAMKEGAYIPPIDVAVIDGRVIARDGHCRTRAARRLVAEGVEYQLEARQLRGNESDAVFHMLGSAQGKAFTPLEQGRGFLRLVRYGHEVADIAKKTGLHRSTIENGLALAEAPVAVQSMVAEGKVSSSLALQTVREHGTKATEKLEAAVKTAEASGKKKATAKHVEPKPRGQTLPPKEKAPAKATPSPAPDKTLESQCVEFVRALADRSTLVTYQTRDFVQLIEAAYDIICPEGADK